MKRAKNHMREWTSADVRRMRRCARARLPARVAAEKLGRSPGATRFKAMMVGVSFRSINRQH